MITIIYLICINFVPENNCSFAQTLEKQNQAKYYFSLKLIIPCLR